MYGLKNVPGHYNLIFNICEYTSSSESGDSIQLCFKLDASIPELYMRKKTNSNWCEWQLIK